MDGWGGGGAQTSNGSIEICNTETTDLTRFVSPYQGDNEVGWVPFSSWFSRWLGVHPQGAFWWAAARANELFLFHFPTVPAMVVQYARCVRWYLWWQHISYKQNHKNRSEMITMSYRPIKRTSRHYRISPSITGGPTHIHYVLIVRLLVVVVVPSSGYQFVK